MTSLYSRYRDQYVRQHMQPLYDAFGADPYTKDKTMTRLTPEQINALPDSVIREVVTEYDATLVSLGDRDGISTDQVRKEAADAFRTELCRQTAVSRTPKEPDDLPNTYVVGFAIDPQYDLVALIRKKRGPKFNVGKLNGAGGHVKIGESPVGAMRREGLEEMGLLLPGSGQWQQFHYERRDDGVKLYFYAAAVAGLDTRLRTMTDEEVVCLPIQGLLRDLADIAGVDNYKDNNRLSKLGDPGSDYVYNLGYLVLMAYSFLKNPQHGYVEG